MVVAERTPPRPAPAETASESGRSSVRERATEALRLASVDPALAEHLAGEAESSGVLVGDWASVSVAGRAPGFGGGRPRLRG